MKKLIIVLLFLPSSLFAADKFVDTTLDNSVEIAMFWAKEKPALEKNSSPYIDSALNKINGLLAAGYVMTEVSSVNKTSDAGKGCHIEIQLNRLTLGESTQTVSWLNLGSTSSYNSAKASAGDDLCMGIKPSSF